MKMTQQRTCTRASGGFTLLEAMIALAVLATGLMTLAVMQLQALSQGSAGRHTTDAAAVTRGVARCGYAVRCSPRPAALGSRLPSGVVYSSGDGVYNPPG